MNPALLTQARIFEPELARQPGARYCECPAFVTLDGCRPHSGRWWRQQATLLKCLSCSSEVVWLFLENRPHR